MNDSDDSQSLMGEGIDLAMALAGILMLVVFALLAQSQFQSQSAHRAEKPDQHQAAAANPEASLGERLRASQGRANDDEREIWDLKRKLNDKPPLIAVSDASIKTFEGGSAVVSADLRNFLHEKIGELYKAKAGYGTAVIEVIGHTDELPMDAKGRCNLDGRLLDVLNGRRDTSAMVACDNVDLGMARATAVVEVLKEFGLGSDFTLIPLSAGSVIDKDGRIADGTHLGISQPERRRIELRLRRSD